MILANLPFWQNHIYFTFCLVGILGLIAGSFFNVVIYRLPIMLINEWQINCAEYANAQIPSEYFHQKRYNLFLPRSHCPKCQHTLHWWENIPLLSFLLLKFCCSNCKKRISFRYPIVEFISSILCIFLLWHYGLTSIFIAAAIFTGYLLVMCMIDLTEKILPDVLTFSLLWLGLIFNTSQMFATSRDAIFGAVIGYLSFWIIASGYKFIAKKDGLGIGDCKLLAALGAWLGWQMLPFIVLFASLVGILISLFLILGKRIQRDTPIPFGPFLAVSGWIAFVWGQSLLNWYWQFFLIISQ